MARGLSSSEAARRVGMRLPHYSHLELHAPAPSWPRAVRIIVALSLPLEAFFPADLILAAAHRFQASADHADRNSESG